MAFQNAEYRLTWLHTIDKMLTGMFKSKMEIVKEAVKDSKAV